MKAVRALLGMLKEAFTDWMDDEAPRLGAALAYYTIFSIAPLLVIAVAIAGLVFGEQAAQGRIVEQIDHVVGGAAAETIEGVLKNARRPGQGVLATVIGVMTLLLGASGAFNELRVAMNKIWEVPRKESGGPLAVVKGRLLSFAMVLVIGFLLLVSLMVSAVLAAVEGSLGAVFDGRLPLLQVLNHALSLAVITALFAVIFKLLPDAEPAVAWKDVWIGAFMTAALFSAGKYAIGLYLGRGTVGSAYGAAGSLAVLLVWVYYAAQIFFFGAELTQVYARRFGSRCAPAGPAAAPEARDGGPAPVASARPFPSLQPARAAGEGGAVARGAALTAALLVLGLVGSSRRR